MNNLKTVSPDTGSPIVAFAKITYLYTLAFVPAIAILYLYLPAPTGLGLISMWVAIPLDVDQRPAGDEAGGLRHDEGERRQAVQDLP
jgi:hypothetical protein